MKLTDIQKQILDADARFKVVIAGRRGGKTYCSIASLAKHARLPNSKCLYIAPTHAMCRQILWSDLKDLLREKNWVKRINESNLEITLINNSIIMLRSADTPDRMRGLGVDHVVIDEAADIDESAWTAVVRPALSDREGSALIISSPKGRNWLYDVYNNAKHLPDWWSLQFSTAQGGNVSEDEIAQARRDLDERTFQQEYLATFVEYSGVIYYAFGDHNIVDMPHPEDTRTPLHIGIDFNVDPCCAVIGFQHGEGIHIIDEIEIYGTDTGEMCKEIQSRYPGRKMIAYPDAAGAQRRTSAGGVTDHIILKNHGMDLRVGSVNPSVKDRIGAVNSVLKADNIRLTISPKCRKIIDALRKHTYKEGTRQPDKGSGLDHFNDAIGYLINHLYPVKQQIANLGKIRRKM
jgi:phage terminase large subunit